MSILDELD